MSTKQLPAKIQDAIDRGIVFDRRKGRGERRMSQPVEIDLGDIQVKPRDRLHKLRPDFVRELAASMDELGLINPIAVRPVRREPGTFVLIFGWHRFEAAKLLGWPTICTQIHTGLSKDEALLMTIDENLIGAPLSPAERMILRLRRDELDEFDR